MREIPYYGIDLFYQKHKDKLHQCVEETFSTGKILMSKSNEDFENRFAKLCNRKYAVTTGSCTDALYFALLASGISQGDEVIVPAFSYIASVTPVLRLGGIPVFVDMDPNNFMIDPDRIEEKISSKTKAIIAVHLMGQSIAMDRIEKIASDNSLILIEDAAQAIGNMHHKRPCGNMGKCSCFSFDPTKIVSAFGTGGILTCDDPEIYKRVKSLRFHGKNMETGEFESLGYNSQIGSFQTAILKYQLDILDDIIKERNELAQIYIKELKNIDEVDIPVTLPGNNHSYSKFIIQVNKRDELKNYLSENNINCMTHYDKLIFEHKVFSDLNIDRATTPIADNIRNKVLSLPLYSGLKREDILYICDKINRFF